MILELQGLRGVAILSVLLFHFFPQFFPGGFIGVDIFFTLSGFLVTKSVVENGALGNNIRQFLISFYAKRIARILPTTLLIALFSVILQLLFSAYSTVQDPLKSFAAAIVGVNNIKLFWAAEDYFSEDSDFNFFTQTWSLGVEEQFYVIFSLIIASSLLLFRYSPSKSPHTYLTIILWLSTILSFCVGIYALTEDLSLQFSFYMLPVRWFELSIGCLLALHSHEKRFLFPIRHAFYLRNIGLLILVVLCFWDLQGIYFPFPINSLVAGISGLICFCSVQLLKESRRSILSSGMLIWLGNISFTLYLLHWVGVVLLRYTFGDESIWVRLLLLGIVLLFSTIIYFYYEKPANVYLRKSALRAFSFAAMCFLSAGLAFGLASAESFQNNELSLSNILNANQSLWGDNLKCHGKRDMASLEQPYQQCLGNSDSGRSIYINGDSHAVQLIFALQEALKDTNIRIGYINTESTEDSYGFTRRKVKKANSEPKALEYIFENARPGDIVLLTFADFRLELVSDLKIRDGFAVWEKYIRKFGSNGVDVILVSDAPTFPKQPIERCILAYKIFDNDANCRMPAFPLPKGKLIQQKYMEMMNKQFNHVFLLDLWPIYCDLNHCNMIKNNEISFFDYHHITEKASKMLSSVFIRFFEENNLIRSDSKKSKKAI